MSNSSSVAVSISSLTITGTGFSRSAVTLPLVLPAGQTAILTVTFAPQAAGTVSGSLQISSNASNASATVALSGTGTASAPPPPTQGTLTVSSSALAFGSVVVGSNSRQDPNAEQYLRRICHRQQNSRDRNWLYANQPGIAAHISNRKNGNGHGDLYTSGCRQRHRQLANHQQCHQLGRCRCSLRYGNSHGPAFGCHCMGCCNASTVRIQRLSRYAEWRPLQQAECVPYHRTYLYRQHGQLRRDLFLHCHFRSGGWN